MARLPTAPTRPQPRTASAETMVGAIGWRRWDWSKRAAGRRGGYFHARPGCGVGKLAEGRKPKPREDSIVLWSGEITGEKRRVTLECIGMFVREGEEGDDGSDG